MVLAVAYTVFIFVAPSDLERKFLNSYEREELDSYSFCEKEGRFLHTYWAENPASRFCEEKYITGHDHKQQLNAIATLKEFDLDDDDLDLDISF